VNQRSSGILMHITSLPSKYGIGTFGKEAYNFIDFLKECSQKYWQILPLNPTSYGDSPYQSFSAFAIDPYFIDFDLLLEDGLLNEEDYACVDFGKDISKVDYENIFNKKINILKIAFKNSKNRFLCDIEEFKAHNICWLDDYTLYMAVKEKHDLKSWKYWNNDIKFREKSAIDLYKKELKESINYWVFVQFIAYKQWSMLKDYANNNDIKIIGDMPIYVAEDSADMWSNERLFLIDENKNSTMIAGCPPDYFCPDGQLWGNPIYDWKYIEGTGFEWWIERFRKASELYDVIRLDHFRGFESYWEIPNKETKSVNGKWVKGPGIELFNKIKDALGDVNIIAEDLGFITKEVIDLRISLGYPGMKVLQFAFDSGKENIYLPHNYEENCVVYIGTHDNETIQGWIENANKKDLDFAINYLESNKEDLNYWNFINFALESKGKLVIIQMQDYLGLNNEARTNIPSTIGCNWTWRVKKSELTKDLAYKINEKTKYYNR